MKYKLILTIMIALAVVADIRGQQTNTNLPNVVVWGEDDSETNVPVDLTNAVSVVSGNGFGFALRSDGTFSGWGAVNSSEIPEDLTNAVAVAPGDYWAVTLRADGTAAIWGNRIRYNVPLPTNFISGLSNVVGISVSPAYDQFDYYIAALCANGSVSTLNGPGPVTNAVAVAAGDGFYMALQSNGKVVVWGGNPPPTQLGTCSAIAAGATHCLALLTNGQVVAWGDNSTGQTSVPAGLSNVVSIAAGSGFSVALQSNGNVVTWGSYLNGAFGGSVSTPSNTPVATSIAAGGGNVVAIVNPNQFNPPPPPPPPTISAQPKSQTIGFGSTATLLVWAIGTGPFSYQWYFNETNAIPGATNRYLSLPNIQVPQIGEYTVVVANAGGSVTSQPASINGLPSLNINMIPGILITGGIGLNYEVQYISAFGPTNATWITLGAVTLTNNPQYYFDVSAVGQPQRFYRVEQSP